MSIHENARSQSAQDTLEDARAGLNAANADDAVAHRLGRAYLSRVEAQIAQADAAITDSSAAQHAQVGEHDHVDEHSAHLLTVMQEIRDAVEVDEQPPAIQTAFGLGAKWSAKQPVDLARGAHALAKAIHDHPAVVRSANIDAQHRHDLIHFADALEHAHSSHVALKADRKDAAATRTHLLAVVRASTHHIRLVARLVHRREPEKLARFVSPVAHHRVTHHAPKPAPAG